MLVLWIMVARNESNEASYNILGKTFQELHTFLLYASQILNEYATESMREADVVLVACAHVPEQAGNPLVFTQYSRAKFLKSLQLIYAF